MRSVWLVGLVAAGAAAAGQGAGATAERHPLAARCWASVGQLARTDRVGMIRVGMPVADVRRICPQARRMRSYDAEANPIEVVVLERPSPSVELIVEEGRIAQIIVRDPRIRDQFGNAPRRALRRGAERAGLVGFEADGNLYAYRAGSCGVTYLLDYEPGDREHRQTWRSSDIQALPPFRIREIGIHRC